MLATIGRRIHEAGRLAPMLAQVSTSNGPLAPAQAAASKPPMMKEFQLYRFDPENDEKPYYKSYRVDINKYASHTAGLQVGHIIAF